jgi:DNA modification methylase
MKPYQEFIKGKINLQHQSGFDIDNSDINPMLFPHQRDIVKWAVFGGCRAVFAAFGLGKTMIQCEIMRIIQSKAGGDCLVIAPLGVKQEFIRDGAKLGVHFKFIRTANEMVDGHHFYITNYESVRDGKLDPNIFTCVSLDEASCLRSYGSKTYQEFLTLFATVKYRFVCTATPSPNRFKELIHYAGFLGIMDTGQSLTRFFQRDSTKANNLTLYPHKEQEFWLWVSSWGLFIQKPSDLGYDDTGYDLPELKVIYHEVTDTSEEFSTEKDGQYKLFDDAALSLKDAAKVKRDSLPARVSKMVEIIKSSPDDHFILWHDMESERHAIKKALPEAVEVYGSQDLELREQRIIDFSDGKYKYLATKPVLSGSGCNFQRHCHKAIFLGIGYKFNDFIQSIHRIYRFLQAEQCEIHIIYADNEQEIMRVLLEKWANHNKMVENMQEIIKRYGLSHQDMEAALQRAIGIERIEVSGKNFRIANNDCVLEAQSMAENSVDLIHTSIPFSNHYEYTPSYNDFGHTENNDHFWAQMDYLTPELLRVLRPGRVYACHVKDRINFGNVTGMGMPTVSPFHAECIAHSIKHGFAYMGMITVVTDVVRENNQTYRLGWSEQCKDGTKMGVGSPEYILLFRKLPTDTTTAYADNPVKKSKVDYNRAQWQVDAHAFWRSSGNRLLSVEEMADLPPESISKLFTDWSLNNIYDYDYHVKIGKELDLKGKLPSTFMTLAPGSHNDYVWHDVNRMITLNGDQKRRNVQLHVCPLQLDIIERIINRYSSEGDMVFDPFGGLMSVPYMALKMGRKACASELNTGYFFDGVGYLQHMEKLMSAPTLFDIEDGTFDLKAA